jgi:hypothetical protein
MYLYNNEHSYREESLRNRVFNEKNDNLAIERPNKRCWLPNDIGDLSRLHPINKLASAHGQGLACILA